MRRMKPKEPKSGEVFEVLGVVIMVKKKVALLPQQLQISFLLPARCPNIGISGNSPAAHKKRLPKI